MNPPTIPLYPELSSTSPESKITNARAMLLGAEAISYLLIGSPALETFSITDLIAASRRLWILYMGAVQAGEDQ
jgi:hypothetical protein